MSKFLIDHVQQAKLAPKPFKCSGCGHEVDTGRVYVKTNHGRYCDACADGLGEPVLAVA